MSDKLITVNEADSLYEVKEVFDKYNVHHIPVVHYKQIIGIISNEDYLAFLQGRHLGEKENIDEALKEINVTEVMTRKLAKLNPDDRIQLAIDLFTMNRFHALPVVEDDELVGIITTHDIILALSKEPIRLADYKQQD